MRRQSADRPTRSRAQRTTAQRTTAQRTTAQPTTAQPTLPAVRRSRRPRAVRALVVAVLAGAMAVPAGSALVAARADDPVPTRQDVKDARAAAEAGRLDVAGVQARLAVANARLEQADITAAKAYEAYNGARYALRQARAEQKAATRRAASSQTKAEKQRQRYADTVATAYRASIGTSALDAIVGADGIAGVIDTTTTLEAADDQLDSQYDSYRAVAVVAEIARKAAARAGKEAQRLADAAEDKKDAAASAQAAASAEATRVATEKQALVRRLARLQNTSVAVAAERQAGLEQRARERAAIARQREAQEAADKARQEAERERERQQQSQPSTPSQPSQPSQPSPPRPSTPPPAPAPTPPAPAGGAQAAVAYARAQIGEPYVWAAAGPDQWDCSGLTMKAWAAGGRSLPHYSVAQYEASTPIRPSDLRPGDLLFWGDTSDPSSIYHVAIYSGNGQMIHAPRPGKGVTEESMYYWITPNFYARP